MERGQDETITPTDNIHDKIKRRFTILKSLPLKDVTIPTNSLPEVRPNLAGKLSTGIAFIKDSFKTLEKE